MSELDSYKKKLQTALKLNGILIRSEFSSLIIESLNNSNIILETNFESCLKIICESLEKHVELERSIERHHIEKAIEACQQSGHDGNETKFTVINAFDIPKLNYDVHRKIYFHDQNKPTLFPSAEFKTQAFVNRYRAVLHRTQRNIDEKNMFAENKVSLHTVDFLLTVSHRILDKDLVLGSLFYGAAGKYHLEDPSGMVELDLTHAKYMDGFFYDSCFALVNGYYSDKILQVSTMILPPGEEYKHSRLTFGSLNYFGGPSETVLRDSSKLLTAMNENCGGMMVLISDLWLDKVTVFEKLEVLFTGLYEMPPIAFVFMGNFLSQCYGSESLEMIRKTLKLLAELIIKFDNIVKYSQFIFVPGINDPSTPYILPRMSLPKTVYSDFIKLVPRSTFATNPCRIQYCTREIVICRSDILSKFLQETVIKPDKEKIDDFVTKTIISQGHLSPFSLNVQPVHWSFDFTLYLYPLPNLVVIGDKSAPYTGVSKGCTIINPGSFVESGFCFKTYTPATESVDDCAL